MMEVRPTILPTNYDDNDNHVTSTISDRLQSVEHEVGSPKDITTSLHADVKLLLERYGSNPELLAIAQQSKSVTVDGFISEATAKTPANRKQKRKKKRRKQSHKVADCNNLSQGGNIIEIISASAKVLNVASVIAVILLTTVMVGQRGVGGVALPHLRTQNEIMDESTKNEIIATSHQNDRSSQSKNIGDQLQRARTPQRNSLVEQDENTELSGIFDEGDEMNSFQIGEGRADDVCSDSEPCSENHFCNYFQEDDIEGSCESCPSSPLVECSQRPLEKVRIDCSLRCQDGEETESKDAELPSFQIGDGRACDPCSDSEFCAEDHYCNYENEDAIEGACKYCPSLDSCTELLPQNSIDDCLLRCQEDENACSNGEHCLEFQFCSFGGFDSGECVECPPGSCLFEDLPVEDTFGCILNCECVEDDEDCRCEKLRSLCHQSTRFADDDATNEWRRICDEAENSCCQDKHCRCKFREELCVNAPNDKPCEYVPHQCCSQRAELIGLEEYYKEDIEEYWFEYQNANCRCDFFTFAVDNLAYETVDAKNNATNKKQLSCQLADGELRAFQMMYNERDILENIYHATNGDYWLINSGWLNYDIDHCNWHGIKCNGDSFVSEIDLTSNNLTGRFDINADYAGHNLRLPHLLESLSFAHNGISGTFGIGNDFFQYRKLERIDVSNNRFNGQVEILMSPALQYLNASHNNFTSVSFLKLFNPSYESLRIVDLSHNRIDQDASYVFRNTPPNTESLILSNNSINGYLPNPFPTFENLLILALDDNNMSGPLPEFQWFLPRLRKLDLSNQHQGFDGMIPLGLSNLLDLADLDFAHNKLPGAIPEDVGNFKQLRLFNVSWNKLNGSIPSSLSKLSDIEYLDLSFNNLTNTIPAELRSLGQNSTVALDGNDGLYHPAPLSLCQRYHFDLYTNSTMCPPERNVLKEFYDSAKGPEWTESVSWAHEHTPHCDWKGVGCATFGSEQRVIILDLPNNGLSGKLTTRIGELQYLQSLDLSDNDMKSKLPTQLGLLTNLTRLRLSYNNFASFDGNKNYLDNLDRLQLLHLHGNRISGTIPILHSGHTLTQGGNVSSFVADCGVPSQFGEALVCSQCSMCCNEESNCIPNEDTAIQQAGFEDYKHFTWVFFLCVVGFSCVVVFVVCVIDRSKKSAAQRADRRQTRLNREARYAIELIGDHSVYSFFLSKSWLGWIIASATIGVQIWMLMQFVRASEFDVSDDDFSDFQYTWKCPRNRIDCEDKADVDWRGWAIFAILLIAHVLKDMINGTKMLILSAKPRHSTYTRIRFFLGGLFLLSVTSFTLYVSAIYNRAIATSNSDIIFNSVIILFVMDVDELLYGILRAINRRWVEEKVSLLPQQQLVENGRNDKDDGSGKLEGDLYCLKIEIDALRETVNILQEQMLAKPQAQA